MNETSSTEPVCPKPEKSRYATREAAELAAMRNQIALGKFLHPYECDPGCGWWHLTSQARIEASPADVAAVRDLDDEAFRDLVVRDGQRRAPRVRAMALRDPLVVHRWVHEIKAVQKEFNEQVLERSKRGDAKSRKWVTDTMELQRVLGLRRREAADIIAATTCTVVPSTRRGEAALRAAAGDLAVGRLIEAHPAEWTRYLVEELTRIGAAIPDRILQRMAEHGIPAPAPP